LHELPIKASQATAYNNAPEERCRYGIALRLGHGAHHKYCILVLEHCLYSTYLIDFTFTVQ